MSVMKAYLYIIGYRFTFDDKTK